MATRKGMMMGRMNKEVATITDQIIPSVLRDAQDRLLLLKRFMRAAAGA
jgi:hypothetical protein